VSRRRRRPCTETPDDLSPEQWAALDRWAREREPWAAMSLSDLVEACLDHHRAVGNEMADWVAACRTWIRNERLWRRRTGGGGNGFARTTPQGRGGGGRGGLVEAMRDGARELGLFPELFD
jgi:hypothetical protein